jgi:RNA polymerase sigma-70 factor, ECF subfamily
MRARKRQRGREVWACCETFWRASGYYPETAFNKTEIDVNCHPTEGNGTAVADQERMKLLVRLLTRHHDELFRFISAMHPHDHDAWDILQESSVALFNKNEEYDPTQPFLPWAFGFAYREVLKFREKNGRTRRLLNKDLLQRLALERAERKSLLDERIEALDECMKELPDADRALIRQRYLSKASIEDLVARLGTSRRSLYRNLDRVRRLLLDGINRRVASADSA